MDFDERIVDDENRVGRNDGGEEAEDEMEEGEEVEPPVTMSSTIPRQNIRFASAAEADRDALVLGFRVVVALVSRFFGQADLR